MGWTALSKHARGLSKLPSPTDWITACLAKYGSPLERLAELSTDKSLPLNLYIQVNQAILPYLHPRLSLTDVKSQIDTQVTVNIVDFGKTIDLTEGEQTEKIGEGGGGWDPASSLPNSPAVNPNVATHHDLKKLIAEVENRLTLMEQTDPNLDQPSSNKD